MELITMLKYSIVAMAICGFVIICQTNYAFPEGPLLL